MRDPATGKCKGVGWVSFEDAAGMAKAVAKVTHHGVQLQSLWRITAAAASYNMLLGRWPRTGCGWAAGSCAYRSRPSTGVCTTRRPFRGLLAAFP